MERNVNRIINMVDVLEEKIRIKDEELKKLILELEELPSKTLKIIALVLTSIFTLITFIWGVLLFLLGWITGGFIMILLSVGFFVPCLKLSMN